MSDGCDPGLDFDGASTWAAVSQPARGKARRAAARELSPGDAELLARPGPAHREPSRRDVVIAWSLVGAFALGLAACLVWGWLERRGATP